MNSTMNSTMKSTILLDYQFDCLLDSLFDYQFDCLFDFRLETLSRSPREHLESNLFTCGFSAFPLHMTFFA